VGDRAQAKERRFRDKVRTEKNRPKRHRDQEIKPRAHAQPVIEMCPRYEKVVDVVNNMRAGGVDQLGLLTEQIQEKVVTPAEAAAGKK